MSDIILSTLNARYIHSAMGLRYLKANMNELEDETHILEFILDTRPIDIVEKILAQQPKIVGFGVYIWNIEQTTQAVGMLKQVAPDITIVLGGPNVSFEQEKQAITQYADYIITGNADVRFYEFCREFLDGTLPAQKIMSSLPVPLEQIQLPYRLYSDEDIANRVIYVEASRGCPFKCEFCLSSLDKTAKPFAAEVFFQEMETLYQRGVRHFKFVDRTFNLNVTASIRILEFFLERMDDQLFLHFEVIPDRLPEKLKAALVKFPPGSLQFEIGVQSLNPDVQTLISRKQDNDKSAENIAWIQTHTHAHIHADLIAGLPSEDIHSFARGFNTLAAMKPHEIQLGILKRLPGTPIIRHTEQYKMVYSPFPPYSVLSTAAIDFATMQRINRFARYWDMIANSGRFASSIAIVLGDSPFERFMQLADWLFKTTQQTHKISLKRLFDIVYQGLTEELAVPAQIAEQTLWQDFQKASLKGMPDFMRNEKDRHKTKIERVSSIATRQNRHN